MFSFKKGTALLLLPVLCFSLFAGCAFSQTPSSSYLTSDGKAVDMENVMIIGDQDISIEEYRYYFLNIKYEYDQGDDTYWTENPEAEVALKEECLYYLKTNAALLLLVDQYGITLDDTDKKTVETNLADTIESLGGQDEYEAALLTSFLTINLYKTFLETEVLKEKLEAVLFSDTGEYPISEDAIKASVQSDFVRLNQIAIALDEEESTTNQDLIQKIYGFATSGMDFDSISSSYSEDDTVSIDVQDYFVTRGELLETLETAAFALEPGQLSNIIDTEYGYFLLKRLEMDDTYITENYDAITSSYQAATLNHLLEQEMSAFSVTYTDQFSLITVTSLS